MNTNNILKWYTGKALENAKAALEMLAESEALGYWKPGTRASVKVPAALKKSSVAKKLAEQTEQSLESIKEEGKMLGTGWGLNHAMEFGHIEKAPDFDLDTLRGLATTDAQRAAIDEAAEWVKTFAPIGALINRLNSTRPVPVFTTMNASATVTKTLIEMGLKDGANVRVCPMKWDFIKDTDKDGSAIRIPVATLLWPENTQHGRTRFSEPDQCNACGHTIRNRFNWIPMLVDSPEGVPFAFWVGRDCAKTLFGVDLKGDLVIKEQ